MFNASFLQLVALKIHNISSVTMTIRHVLLALTCFQINAMAVYTSAFFCTFTILKIVCSLFCSSLFSTIISVCIICHTKSELQTFFFSFANHFVHSGFSNHLFIILFFFNFSSNILICIICHTHSRRLKPIFILVLWNTSYYFGA